MVAALAKDPASKLKPIVVLFSNDMEGDPASCDTAPVPASQDASVRNHLGRPKAGMKVPEILTSLLGLYNSRTGHGAAEIGMLRNQLCQPSAHFFHLDLPKPSPPP